MCFCVFNLETNLEVSYAWERIKLLKKGGSGVVVDLVIKNLGNGGANDNGIQEVLILYPNRFSEKKVLVNQGDPAEKKRKIIPIAANAVIDEFKNPDNPANDHYKSSDTHYGKVKGHNTRFCIIDGRIPTHYLHEDENEQVKVEFNVKGDAYIYFSNKLSRIERRHLRGLRHSLFSLVFTHPIKVGESRIVRLYFDPKVTTKEPLKWYHRLKFIGLLHLMRFRVNHEIKGPNSLVDDLVTNIENSEKKKQEANVFPKHLEDLRQPTVYDVLDKFRDWLYEKKDVDLQTSAEPEYNLKINTSVRHWKIDVQFDKIDGDLEHYNVKRLPTYFDDIAKLMTRSYYWSSRHGIDFKIMSDGKTEARLVKITTILTLLSLLIGTMAAIAVRKEIWEIIKWLGSLFMNAF